MNTRIRSCWLNYREQRSIGEDRKCLSLTQRGFSVRTIPGNPPEIFVNKKKKMLDFSLPYLIAFCFKKTSK